MGGNAGACLGCLPDSQPCGCPEALFQTIHGLALMAHDQNGLRIVAPPGQFPCRRIEGRSGVADEVAVVERVIGLAPRCNAGGADRDDEIGGGVDWMFLTLDKKEKSPEP